MSQGFGVVELFEITPISETEFKEHYKRPIPADPKDKKQVSFRGFYPPYHLSINQGFCYEN